MAVTVGVMHLAGLGRGRCRLEQDNEAGAADLPGLRLLRRLVTVLTAVMIGGIVLIVALLWMRLNAPPAPGFPASLALPDGAVPLAVTRGPGFVIVVTEDRRIFVLDPTGAEIVDELRVRLPE